MEPGRFDDVDIRWMEDPEPPRRPPSLRRRMGVALSAWIIAAGVLAAGASALTGGNQEANIGKATQSRTAEGVPFVRDGHVCHRGDAHRSSSSARYSQSNF
jgi:hypothetical protein